MKIQIEHDHQGEIHAVAIAVRKANLAMTLRPRPGRQVEEVDAAHVEHPDDWENLQRTRRDFRVALDAAGARLVKKGERAG